MAITTHGIVALVRNSGGGKFLLIEDMRKQVYGMWAPPHGCCEDIDKTEKDGVIREVYEKVGLRITPIEKVLTQKADTTVKTVSFWTVEYGENQIIHIDDKKLSNYGWFTIDESLEHKLYPGTRIFFEKVQSGEVIL